MKTPTGAIESAAPVPPRRHLLLAAGTLVLVGLAAYHNSLGGPFIFDDVSSITNNPSIRGLGTGSMPPGGGLTVSGRPLLNFSLALNYALGGERVWGYHAVNLGLHLLAALALFGVVRRTLLLPFWRGRFAGAALPLGVAVAGLWTVHPLQTESVTYVVQRAESLAGLLHLLTLYAFLRSVDSPRPMRWRAAAVGACLLGMTAKETMVTAPVLVCVYDRTLVAGSFAEAWRRRRGFYLGLAAAWLPLAALVAGTGNRGGTAGFGVVVGWWAYVSTQFRAVAVYLGLAGWPHPLSIDHGTEWAHGAADIVPYAVPVVLLAAGAWIALRRRWGSGVAGAWFFAILAPTSLVPGIRQTIVEHRMYLPLAAMLAVIVPGLYTLAGRRLTLAGLALAAGLGVLTVDRNADYRSAEAMWSDTVAKQPGNIYARCNYGIELGFVRRYDAARMQFEAALALDPDYALAESGLGYVLFRSGRTADAIAHVERAVRLRPELSQPHWVLAEILAETGRPAEAVGHYRRALESNPAIVAGYNRLGLALEQTDRRAESVPAFEEAVRRDPRSAEAQTNLGWALARLGRPAEALPHFEAALRLDPAAASSEDNLGNALFMLGRLPEARAHFENALRLDPRSADAHNNIGNVLLELGRTPEALGHYRRAVELDPAFAEAQCNLANVLVLLGRAPEAIGHYEASLRANPDYAQARENLARVRSQLGRR